MEFYVAKVRLQRNMSIRALAEKSGVAKSHMILVTIVTQ